LHPDGGGCSAAAAVAAAAGAAKRINKGVRRVIGEAPN